MLFCFVFVVSVTNKWRYFKEKCYFFHNINLEECYF